MAGQVKAMINEILSRRSQGNAHWVPSLKLKLIFKGIDPDQWQETSPDDPGMISRVRTAAESMGVPL